MREPFDPSYSFACPKCGALVEGVRDKHTCGSFLRKCNCGATAKVSLKSTGYRWVVNRIELMWLVVEREEPLRVSDDLLNKWSAEYRLAKGTDAVVIRQLIRHIFAQELELRKYKEEAK